MTPGESGGRLLHGGRGWRERSLSSVDFSFSWTGSPGGGAPREAIPVDTNGDGVTDGYAALDWSSCGNASTGGTVSTTSATCPVYYGSTAYPSWDAFAAANPGYTVSRDLPFVIVDVTSAVDVTNVTFG